MAPVPEHPEARKEGGLRQEQQLRRPFLRLEIGAYKERKKLSESASLAREERVQAFSIARKIWDSSMGGVFAQDINERYRMMIGFLDRLKEEYGGHHGCGGKCSAPDHYGFEFIDLMKNVHDRKNGEDMSGGQLPGISFLSSTSLSNFSAIFCGNEYKIEGGVAREGSFGTASGMRELAHMEEASDFTPLMYMLDHYLHEQHHSQHDAAAPYFRISEHVAPFIPCIGDYDCQAPGASFEKVAKFQIDRLSLLREKIIAAGGHSMENGGDTYTWVFNNTHRFMMVPLVHDVETRKVYAVREENGGVVREEFAAFAERAKFADGTPLLSNVIARKYVENVKKYEGNVYATELIRRRGCCKLECCVDSREGNTAASGVIREIGGYPSEKSLKRTIENGQLRMLKLQLHTDCGYINLGIGLHKMFSELQRAQKEPGSRERLETVWFDLERIMHGHPVPTYTSAAEIAGELGLNEGKGLFLSLFAGIPSEAEDGEKERARLDFRRALKHMYDRGIIAESRRGGFCIGAAEKTAGRLAKNGLDGGGIRKEDFDRLFAYLVTEEMGRDIREMAERMAAEEEKKVGRKVEVEVRIKSLKNKGFYSVGREFSVADVLNSTRFMFSDVDKEGNMEFKVADVFHSLGQEE